MQFSGVKVGENWFVDNLYEKFVYTPVFDRFDRCNLSVIHEMYTDFTLLLPEFYQRNPSDEHVFTLTLYPPNSGKTNDTDFNMVYLIKFHVCAKQVGEPYTLGSSNNVFHIIFYFI